MASEWYVRDGLREIGPLGLNDLRTMARGGRLAAETPVRVGRAGVWIPADKVPGLLQPTEWRSRSGPPPLPSAPNRLPEDTGPVKVSRWRRKAAPGTDASWLVGLACLGGIAVVGVLFAVLISVGNGRNNQAPAEIKVGTHDGPIVQRVVSAPAAPPRDLSPQPSHEVSLEPSHETDDNWAVQIGDRAKSSVVLVLTKDGLGTGFVVASRDNRRLLLTNRHVLTSSGRRPEVLRQCQIYLPSKSWAVGQLAAVAKDDVDLAIVLVQSPELNTLGPIAEFDSVRPGEHVAAIGNPCITDPKTHEILKILNNKLDLGNVSGKFDELLIGHNAPTNHGNSGGPLVDMRGRVVGVNTLAFHYSGMEGTNFAVRADIVLDSSKWNFSIDVSDLLREISR